MASTDTMAVGRELRLLFLDGTAAGMTDSQLVERFVLSDGEAARPAFEAILTRHGPAVLSRCRRVLGDHTEAEDASQATFLVLVRRAGSIRVGDSLAPWLIGVPHRTALKARTGERRRRAREGRVAIHEATVSPVATHDDMPPLVRGEVDRLPGRYRDLVRLCYFEGRTHDEAADALGCPVGTVRGRLARARGLLRSRLTRRGIAPAAWLAAEGLAEAQSEIPPTLHAVTLEAATRGGKIRAEVATLAVRVLRGMAETKAVAIAAGLAVTLIATGAGLAAILGRQDDGPRKAPQPAAVVQAPAPGAAKVNLYGDPVPRGAIARMGTVRFGHADPNRGLVSRVLFADSGRSLITVSENNDTRVWDVSSGRLIRSIEGEKAALSPDGKTLITTTDGRDFDGKKGLIQLWDFASGRELRRVETDSRTRYSLPTLSPDGSTLAGVVVHLELKSGKHDTSLVFWDAATLAERLRRRWIIPPL